MKPSWRIVVVCSLFTLAAGATCSSDDSSAGCPQTCPAGTVCDAASGQCVAEAGCAQPCTGNTVCDTATGQCVPEVDCAQTCAEGTVCNPATGQCVPEVDCPQACASGTTCDPVTGKCVAAQTISCAGACGPNAYCSEATEQCECDAGYADCNADIGKTGTDGCECQGSCTDGQCGGTTVAECKPNVLNDCGDATRYCDVDHCVACPGDTYNCDKIGDCESDTDCAADGCETLGDKTCVSQSQFCDETTGLCENCPPGTFNCNRALGDCECDTACDGTFCEKQCTSTVGCGDPTQYCDFGKCVACPAGQENCDGMGACECQGTCNGTQCSGDVLCDYYDQNVCGGDQQQWCYQNKCLPCTDKYNCNGTMGCECDDAGCNGTACAGKCSGGEC